MNLGIKQWRIVEHQGKNVYAYEVDDYVLMADDIYQNTIK